MNLAERISASVRARVTVVASLFVLTVTAVGSVVAVLVIGHTISNSLIDSARQDAAAIQAQLARGVQPAVAATTGRNDVVVQLLDARGRVIASDRSSGLTVPLMTRVGVSTGVVAGATDSFTLVAVKARSAGAVDLIVVGRSTEQRDETRAETAGVLTVSVPLIVAMLAVIVWISVGRALRPVEVMRAEADQINAAHLPRRLAVPPGADEIPRLARTLNEMLDRIDEGQRRQRRFVSDASHELRSPLAVIRQAAEIGRTHPERFSVDSLAEDVLHESSRLEELVSALLLLARLEDDNVGPTEPVDVDDLVLAEVARIRPVRPEVTLDASGVGAGRTTGNALLLGQVVHNLLVNALRHAHTRVRISLGQDHEVVLHVDDDGDGISPTERERIFERFVRLDEARTRDDGGSGLGLAIVHSIVHASGGSVGVTDSPLGGARFEVRLPMADEDLEGPDGSVDG